MNNMLILKQGLQALQQAWDWWLAGLQASLPASWRQADEQVAGYYLQGTARQFGLYHAGAALGVASHPGALTALLAAVPAAEPLRVILAPEEVLVQDLRLPAAVAAHLEAAVGFELDRYSPLPAEQIYYAVICQEIQAERLLARLYLTPRQPLAPWLETLVRLGRRVVAVQVVGTSVNLLPQAQRAATARWYLWQWLLLGITGLLAVAVLATPLWYARAQVVLLLPAAAEARIQAAQVSALRNELELAQQSSQFLQRKKATTPQLIEVLATLTQLLPDDTWLQRIELQQYDLQLRGESAAAAALIERLEASPLFAEVNFRSPVTREPRTGRDQFHLGLRVVTAEGNL